MLVDKDDLFVIVTTSFSKSYWREDCDGGVFSFLEDATIYRLGELDKAREQLKFIGEYMKPKLCRIKFEVIE